MFLFYILAFWPQGMWDLSFLTQDWTHIPWTGRQSLNHWTTREVPWIPFCLLDPWVVLGSLHFDSDLLYILTAMPCLNMSDLFLKASATKTPNQYSTQCRNLGSHRSSNFCIQGVQPLHPAYVAQICFLSDITSVAIVQVPTIVCLNFTRPLNYHLPSSPHGNFSKMQIGVLKNYSTTIDAVKLCTHILLVGL